MYSIVCTVCVHVCMHVCKYGVFIMLVCYVCFSLLPVLSVACVQHVLSSLQRESLGTLIGHYTP